MYIIYLFQNCCYNTRLISVW